MNFEKGNSDGEGIVSLLVSPFLFSLLSLSLLFFLSLSFSLPRNS